MRVPIISVAEREYRRRLDKKRLVKRALVVAACIFAVDVLGLLPKVPRTRMPSLYGQFYDRLSPEEFRGHFRLPRDLFDFVFNKLQEPCEGYPKGPLHWEYVRSFRTKHDCVSRCACWLCVMFYCVFWLNVYREPYSGAAVPVVDKLALYIARLANGTTYRELGQLYDVSDSYASRIAARVSNAIVSVFGNEISWPSRAEALHSRDLFFARHGISGCIAAVDGTDIRLRADSSTRLAQFNIKKFYSFKLHAMVDNKYV